jgi:hypothetical protein
MVIFLPYFENKSIVRKGCRFPSKALKFIAANNNIKKKLWPESARELYRPNDRRLSAKLVPAFADRGCHVVIVTDPYGRILAFLDRKNNNNKNNNTLVISK